MSMSISTQQSTVCGWLVCLSLVAHALPVTAQDADVVRHFTRLTRASEWQPVGTISIRFPAHHPQGMVVVGDYIFFSSVEVTIPTERFERPVSGYDRTPGEGVGHLFKTDRQGNLIAHVTLGEGSIYHPGGIDFDGTFIWIPVAEYRPNSRSIIYRVDPVTMEATEAFRFEDHIGAIVHDTMTTTLHGVSWGSRSFYAWELSNKLGLSVGGSDPAALRIPNGSHYVDYQDCHSVAERYMLCGGVSTHDIRTLGASGGQEITLGGLDLIDLQSRRAVHQLPITWQVEPNLVVSTNPFFVELKDEHLRFHFMPQDNRSTIYIFDALRD
jgi:hypothetical protein